MYKTLWNLINNHGRKHVSGLFLTALVLGWSTAGLLAGALICLAGNFTSLASATILFCSTGYSGLIFGFLGGIFHLYRAQNLPKKTFQNNTTFSLTQKAA